MIIVYRPKVLNVNVLFFTVLFSFVPDGKSAFSAHTTSYIYI